MCLHVCLRICVTRVCVYLFVFVRMGRDCGFVCAYITGKIGKGGGVWGGGDFQNEIDFQKFVNKGKNCKVEKKESSLVSLSMSEIVIESERRL